MRDRQIPLPARVSRVRRRQTLPDRERGPVAPQRIGCPSDGYRQIAEFQVGFCLECKIADPTRGVGSLTP